MVNINPFIVALIVIVLIGVILYLLGELLEKHFPKSKITRFVKWLSDLIAHR